MVFGFVGVCGLDVADLMFNVDVCVVCFWFVLWLIVVSVITLVLIVISFLSFILFVLLRFALLGFGCMAWFNWRVLFGTFVFDCDVVRCLLWICFDLGLLDLWAWFLGWLLLFVVFCFGFVIWVAGDCVCDRTWFGVLDLCFIDCLVVGVCWVTWFSLLFVYESLVYLVVLRFWLMFLKLRCIVGIVILLIFILVCLFDLLIAWAVFVSGLFVYSWFYDFDVCSLLVNWFVHCLIVNLLCGFIVLWFDSLLIWWYFVVFDCYFVVCNNI